MYSKPIRQLIQAFSRLPSVGQRTAERFVFYLLKSGKKDVGELTIALRQLIETIKSCAICWDFSDQSPCAICQDKTRDTSTICIVQEPQDVQAIERTGSYKGVYHVIRGLLRPDDMDALQYLKINELIARTKESSIKELIFALNPTLEGETTTMYIEQRIKESAPQIKITRLARGLPMGSDLQYADDITLDNALKHRIEIQ